MDPRRLLVFRTVARAGSISAGARELGWTQPAASQHLAALEREAGSPLLSRTPQGVRLTEAGRLLLTHADAIAGRLQTAREEQQQLASGSLGTADIVAFPSAAATILPGALARMRRRFPGIRVRLSEAEPPEAIARVRAGEADLALTFRFPDLDPVSDDLSVRRLRDDPVQAVVSEAGPPPATLAELAEEEWVAGCERCRRHLLHNCAAAGFEPRISHVTDDYVVVQALVAAGVAVAVLPRLATRAVRTAGVRTVTLPGLTPRAIEVVHRQGAEKIPAVAASLSVIDDSGEAASAG